MLLDHQQRPRGCRWHPWAEGERSARGAKLTDAGTRLYEHAGRGIEVFLEAEQAVRSDQARLKGRLRLSLTRMKNTSDSGKGH
jgi:hypothetical protein